MWNRIANNELKSMQKKYNYISRDIARFWLDLGQLESSPPSRKTVEQMEMIAASAGRREDQCGLAAQSGDVVHAAFPLSLVY